MIDLKGKRFGRLVVMYLDPSPYYDKTQGRRWVCGCDCGNEVSVTTGKLNAGRVKSCGCYRRDLAVERINKLNAKGKDK